MLKLQKCHMTHNNLIKMFAQVCLSAPAIPQHQQVTSPEDLQFLKDVSALKIQEIPTRENGSFADQSSSSQFNESWPSSTEQTGSLGTPVSDSTLASPEMSQQMREWLTGQDAKPATKSTLGWQEMTFSYVYVHQIEIWCPLSNITIVLDCQPRYM